MFDLIGNHVILFHFSLITTVIYGSTRRFSCGILSWSFAPQPLFWRTTIPLLRMPGTGIVVATLSTPPGVVDRESGERE